MMTQMGPVKEVKFFNFGWLHLPMFSSVFTSALSVFVFVFLDDQLETCFVFCLVLRCFICTYFVFVHYYYFFF